MKLLNLGCGDQRPVDTKWTHLDDLHSQFAPGTPERDQLDAQANYMNWCVRPDTKLPFIDEYFDGILASHFFEHWDAQDCLKIMRDCHRLLKPGGVLMVSVPDAGYFRRVNPEDRNENWPILFGVTDPANTIPTWMEAALFFEQHKQLFTEDALWCFLKQSGFIPSVIQPVIKGEVAELAAMLNRREFSVEMMGFKQ